MTASQGTRPDAADRLRRRGNVTVFSILGLVVLLVLAVLVGGEAVRSYDRSHLVRVTCTVTSAQGGLGGSARTLVDQVDITTAECGDLVLRSDVTDDNEAEIAQELEQDRRVSFRVGELSWRWRAVLPRFRIPVVVVSYRAA